MFNFLVFIFHTLLVGKIYYALFHGYRMTDQNMAEFGLVSLSMFGLSVYVWSLCLCLVSVSMFGLCVSVWSLCVCLVSLFMFLGDTFGFLVQFSLLLSMFGMFSAFYIFN